MLINRIFSGNDAVYGLTEKAVNDAVQANGADKAVGFPHTAYCLPCYYAVTGVKIKTLGELKEALGVVKSLMNREETLDNALMSGVATALCAEFIEALKYLDGAEPYLEPCYGHLADAVIRELGVPLVTGDIPGVAVILGTAPSVEEGVALVKSYQSQGILVTLVGGIIDQVKENAFTPTIITKNDMPVEFSSIHLTGYEQDASYQCTALSDVSTMLRSYYETKEILTRIHQKSSDLRRITTTALERATKKYDLQSRQLKDTQKREKYKIYGELLTTYGYELQGGEKSLTCDNYYTNEPVTIPLDETKSALENAKRYFDRYAKQKRTYEALTVQIAETKEDIEHLESISNALDIARQESDLADIKRELTEYGYIRKHSNSKRGAKHSEKSKPMHFISSDGFDMYVGKNNYQNDELTFHLATGNDWWFHAKASAGSHVIVKTEGKELPDQTFEEAARLAAHFSKASSQDKAEVDYIQKKHIKKPNGSKPGFVVYYTNYSMTISTDITGIREV